MTTTVEDIDVNHLQKLLEQKTADIAAFSSTFTVEDGDKLVVSTEKANAFRKTLNEAKELRQVLADYREVKQLQEFGPEYKQWHNAAAQPPAAAADAARAHLGGFERKTLTDYVLESPEFKSRNRADPRFNVEIDGFNIGQQMKAIYGGGQTPSGGTASYNALGGAENIGILERAVRQKRIRDLFPQATTDKAILIGVRETGFTNNAAVVKVRNSGNTDFQAKPESTITLASVSYPVAVIAHFLRAHASILDDEPRLRDFLNRRMLDGLRLAEDREIMYGTPGAENITGITQTSGVQVYTGLSSDQLSAQIRKAATLAMLAEYEPNGLVLSPADWETLELEQTATGEYRIAVSVAVGGQKKVWSMDIVSTTACTPGHYLVGSFGYGAQFYDRQKANVVVSTEDSDNFQKNLITIRAEERGALEVARPESFVYGTITAYSPTQI